VAEAGRPAARPGRSTARSGSAPRRSGNAHPNLVPYQDFPTSDGYVVIAVGTDAQFARLCVVLGVAELAIDSNFVTNRQRVVNRRELTDKLNAVTVTHSTAHWVAALERVGVPAGPINSLDAVFDDTQVLARAMRIELPHPVAGTVPLVANPLNLSETPVTYRCAPPLLGEQTHEVLAQRLAMSDAQIHALRAKGII
jgi:crotonobetainyl-CoA:carnitine CoA-transferase CaiB-like acyl-CoA transferase